MTIFSGRSPWAGTTAGGTKYRGIKPRAGWANTDRLLLFPSSSVTGLVVACHGIGGNEDTIIGNMITLTEACLDNGWAVIGADAYGPAWANQLSVDEYGAFIDWARVRLPNIARVVTIGQSMGGLAALHLASTLTDAVGFYGVAAVCSLEDQYANYTDHRASIETAYPGWATPGTWDDVVTAGHDPLGDFAAASFAGLRMRWVASSTDPVVDKTTNTDAMAGFVAGQVAEDQVVAVAGGHLSSEHYLPADLSAFLARCT